MRNRPILVALLLLLAVARTAGAQAPSPSATGAPADTDAERDEGAAPRPLPSLPPIDDPLLNLPDTGARALGSWNEALQLLRRQSPDYRANVDNVLRAAAQARVALAAVLPNLSAQASYTHQFVTQTIVLGGSMVVTPPPDVFAAAASLTWSVLNPRALYDYGTARGATEVAQRELEDRRRTLALAAVNAMLSTLAEARVSDVNRVGLRAALERLELARTRNQFGQGTALDVDRADQDAAAARALVISSDEALRQGREALGLVLGSRTPLGAPGDLDLARFEEAVASTCRVSSDIEQRADILAALARRNVAARGVTSAWLRLAPVLGLSSQLGYNSAVTFGPLTTWNVSAALVFPLYDGGARYGYLRDAKAARDQAEQALIAARLAALVDATQAERGIAVYTAARDVAQKQRDLAQRIDERTRAGYTHGLFTSLDLVTSAQALRLGEINLVQAQLQLSEARVRAVLAKAQCVF